MPNQFVARNGIIASSDSVITGSLNVTGSILQNGGALAVQDGTILYHNIKWFTPTSTVSTSGTTITSVGTQFSFAMVGAKLTINGESRLISIYSNPSQVSVDSAFSQNYSAITASNWGVYSKSLTIATADNPALAGGFEFRNSTNASLLTAVYDRIQIGLRLADAGNNVAFNTTGVAEAFQLANDKTLVWYSGSSAAYNALNTSVDTGLRKNSPGILEIYNGNTADGALANRRDLLLRNITGSNATFSGSLLVNGSSSFTGSVGVLGNLTTTGTITAQTLVVQTISSSIEYASGSNIFGSSLTNTQSMTGSVGITGSLTVAGNILPSPTITYTLGSNANQFGNIWASNGVISTLFTTLIRASGNSVLFGSNQTNYWGGFIGSSPTSSGNLILSYTTSSAGLVDNGYKLQVYSTGSASGSLFVSSSGVAATLIGSGSNVFSVDGTSGRLFSIDDSLSGSLFSVNTAAGLPVMEAFSDNTVRVGQFGKKILFVSPSGVGIGKETLLNANLDISGSSVVTGSFAITGSETTVGVSIVTGSAFITGSLTVTGSLNVTGSILQNGGSLAVQDGTILYHSVKWFTPSSTVSTSGNTVTSVGTQFTSGMVGAKLTISGESRLVATYTSTTQVVVDSAYSQNYSAITASNWGVFSRAIHIDSSGNRSHYSTLGVLQQSNNYFPQGVSAAAYSSNANTSYFFDGGLYTNASGAVTWGSGTTANTSLTARDLGIRRNTSGSLEIYDGNTADGALANRRDLLVRNITGSNALFSGSLYSNGLSTFDGTISGSYVASNPSSSLVLLTGSIQPSASLGGTSAMYVNTVLSASANSQTLVGLDIAPTFTVGSFTSVSKIGLRNSGFLSIITGAGTSFQSPFGINGLHFAFDSDISTITSAQQGTSGRELRIYSHPLNVYSSQTGIKMLTLFSTGNLILQNGGTFTDAGFRLDVSGSTRLNGPTTIISASLNYQENLAVTTGSFQTILSVATGSYRSAFFDYVTYSGSIVRAGTLVSTWSGSNTEYFENYTNDLGGSTAVVTLQTAISASNIVLQAGISGSAWSVRSLVRLL
jgi:hypothetical protein